MKMKRRRCSSLLTSIANIQDLDIEKNTVLTSLDILNLVFVPERFWSKCFEMPRHTWVMWRIWEASFTMWYWRRGDRHFMAWLCGFKRHQLAMFFSVNSGRQLAFPLLITLSAPSLPNFWFFASLFFPLESPIAIFRTSLLFINISKYLELQNRNNARLHFMCNCPGSFSYGSPTSFQSSPSSTPERQRDRRPLCFVSQSKTTAHDTLDGSSYSGSGPKWQWGIEVMNNQGEGSPFFGMTSRQ